MCVAMPQVADNAKECGDPGAIRTRDPQLRRLVVTNSQPRGNASVSWCLARSLVTATDALRRMEPQR